MTSTPTCVVSLENIDVNDFCCPNSEPDLTSTPVQSPLLPKQESLDDGDRLFEGEESTEESFKARSISNRPPRTFATMNTQHQRYRTATISSLSSPHSSCDTIQIGFDESSSVSFDDATNAVKTIDEESLSSSTLILSQLNTVDDKKIGKNSLTSAVSYRVCKGKPSSIYRRASSSNGSSGCVQKKQLAQRTRNNGKRRIPITATVVCEEPLRRGRPKKSKEKTLSVAYPFQQSAMQANTDSDISTNKTTGTTSLPKHSIFCDDYYTVGVVKRDDDEHHAVTVLCSADEQFILDQDMCVCCGSFGLLDKEEGRLISCTQCGQCYHTFCAFGTGVTKLSKVILKRGWRCLDCTVCEGCGKTTDENLLLLCDDCDISYHTYCLQPPLDQVPKGNWKCQWCVRCLKCGSTAPGPSHNDSICSWKNNYTECDPCYSARVCSVCSKSYKDNELVLQCVKCERWSHAMCENIPNEDRINEQWNNDEWTFTCLLCKPSSSLSDQTVLIDRQRRISSFDQEISDHSSPSPPLAQPKRGIYDEGVYLTDSGLSQLKYIRTKLNNAIYSPPQVKKSKTVKKQNQNDEQTVATITSKTAGVHDETIVKKVNKLAKGYSGIGGFYTKSHGRSRSKRNNSVHQMDVNVYDEFDDMSMQRGNKSNRRKRKSTLEEHMPPEMQEAFFGNNLVVSTRTLASNKMTNDRHNNIDDYIMTNGSLAFLKSNDSCVMDENSGDIPTITSTTLTNHNDNSMYTIQLESDILNNLMKRKKISIQQQQQPRTTQGGVSNVKNMNDDDDINLFEQEGFEVLFNYFMGNSTIENVPVSSDIEDFIQFVTDERDGTIVNRSQSKDSAVHCSRSDLSVPTNPLTTGANDNSKQIISNMAREMMESTFGNNVTNQTIAQQQQHRINQNIVLNQNRNDSFVWMPVHSNDEQQLHQTNDHSLLNEIDYLRPVSQYQPVSLQLGMNNHIGSVNCLRPNQNDQLFQVTQAGTPEFYLPLIKSEPGTNNVLYHSFTSNQMLAMREMILKNQTCHTQLGKKHEQQQKTTLFPDKNDLFAQKDYFNNDGHFISDGLHSYAHFEQVTPAQFVNNDSSECSFPCFAQQQNSFRQQPRLYCLPPQSVTPHCSEYQTLLTEQQQPQQQQQTKRSKREIVSRPNKRRSGTPPVSLDCEISVNSATKSSSCFILPLRQPSSPNQQLECSRSDNVLPMTRKTSRIDSTQYVAADVLEKVDEVINDVIQGRGEISVSAGTSESYTSRQFQTSRRAAKQEQYTPTIDEKALSLLKETINIRSPSLFMTESISNNIEIKQENVCIGSSPGDLRIQSSSTPNRNSPMIRTSSIESSNPMTILVQNPFDETHHVSPNATLLHSPSNETTSKFLINSPQVSSVAPISQSPSKQHSLTNLHSPRNVATPNQMIEQSHLINNNNNPDGHLDASSPNRPQQA
ncbi:unnamed protein product, partial [Didymodactylos carnosus]